MMESIDLGHSATIQLRDTAQSPFVRNSLTLKRPFSSVLSHKKRPKHHRASPQTGLLLTAKNISQLESRYI